MKRKLAIATAIWIWICGATAEPITVVTLGDSLTHGFGLPPEAGFVQQMESWLNRNGAEVTMVNAGVSGDTTAGGAARISWTLTPEVDALIVVLGANDALRGIDPQTVRANLAHILATAKRAGLSTLLVGIRAPGNFGPEYKLAFESIYPDLAREFGTLYVEDFLGAYAKLGDAPANYAPFMQSDMLHPNAGGVALVVADLGPTVLLLVENTVSEPN